MDSRQNRRIRRDIWKETEDLTKDFPQFERCNNLYLLTLVMLLNNKPKNEICAMLKIYVEGEDDSLMVDRIFHTCSSFLKRRTNESTKGFSGQNRAKEDAQENEEDFFQFDVTASKNSQGSFINRGDGSGAINENSGDFSFNFNGGSAGSGGSNVGFASSGSDEWYEPNDPWITALSMMEGGSDDFQGLGPPGEFSKNVPSEAPLIPSGEENEVNVFESQAVLVVQRYCLEDNQSGWGRMKDTSKKPELIMQGLGTMRLNTEKESGASRIIVRRKHGRHVIVNRCIDPNMQVKIVESNARCCVVYVFSPAAKSKFEKWLYFVTKSEAVEFCRKVNEVKRCKVRKEKFDPRSTMPYAHPRMPLEVVKKFKVTIVGDGGVGKSQLVRYFQHGNMNKPYLPTIGVEVHPVRFYTNKGVYDLALWDTAGQERFGGLRDGYYIASNAGIIVFDLSQGTRNLPTWYRDLVRVCEMIPICIIGNKMDFVEDEDETVAKQNERDTPPKQMKKKAKKLDRQKVMASAKVFSRRKNLFYTLCSVKNQTAGLSKCFRYLLQRLVNSWDLEIVDEPCYIDYAPFSAKISSIDGKEEEDGDGEDIKYQAIAEFFEFFDQFKVEWKESFRKSMLSNFSYVDLVVFCVE